MKLLKSLTVVMGFAAVLMLQAHASAQAKDKLSMKFENAAGQSAGQILLSAGSSASLGVQVIEDDSFLLVAMALDLGGGVPELSTVTILAVVDNARAGLFKLQKAVPVEIEGLELVIQAVAVGPSGDQYQSDALRVKITADSSASDKDIGPGGSEIGL